MRVLHVINSLGASGGAEHGLVREIGLLSDGFEHRVVRLFEKDQLGADLEALGIGVEPLGLNSSRAGWNWPLATERLVRVIRDFVPDVIHSSLFSANLVAQFAGKRASVPVLSTFTLSGDGGTSEDVPTRGRHMARCRAKTVGPRRSQSQPCEISGSDQRRPAHELSFVGRGSGSRNGHPARGPV